MTRQLHLDPVRNEQERLAELRREVRKVSSQLGWTPEDLDLFCEEMVGDPMLLWSADTLEWLLRKFTETMR